MNEREKQIADGFENFFAVLPDRMQDKHLGAIICMLFEAFDVQHENRADICEGVLNAMLEADMRKEESAAQAAEDVIARAAAKARK